MENDKKEREFHAKPVPKAIYEYTRPVPPSKKPQQALSKPKNLQSDNCITGNIKLSTEIRADARRKFKLMQTQKLNLQEEARKKQETEARKLERIEIARMRRQAEFKANPMPQFEKLQISSRYQTSAKKNGYNGYGNKENQCHNQKHNLQ